MDKRIFFLKKHMLSNLRHSPTMEEMARSVNLSESHLQQLFKSVVGMSPIQYLQDLRLEKARELLENSFLQIREIGFRVGMSDQSHFIHDFKGKYGMTPSEYRRQHWAKAEADANES
jgi:AraC-like DNA-binding protein